MASSVRNDGVVELRDDNELARGREDNSDGLRLGRDPNSPQGVVVHPAGPVDSYGRTYIGKSLSAGTSELNDSVRRQQTDQMIAEVAAQIQQAYRTINELIDEFRTSSNAANQKSRQYSLEMMDKMLAGKKPSPEDSNDATLMDAFAKQVAQRYYDTATQLLDLQKINNAGHLELSAQLVQEIFEQRKGDLEQLSAKLKTMQIQESHELVLQIDVRNQALKEQSLQFDSWMQKLKFGSENTQQELTLNVEERAQKYQQEKDLKELWFQEKKISDDGKLNDKKLEYDRQFKEQRLKYKADLRNRHLSIKANSSCSVM